MAKLKSENLTSFNELSPNLRFDGPHLMSVTIFNQLPEVSSDANGQKCLVMFALSCACGH